MNLGTGTVALPGGVPDGLTYDGALGRRSPTVTEQQLLDATITPVDRSEELELLPPPVRNLAADLVEGHDGGWDQMAAIRDEFVDQGYYDATPTRRPATPTGASPAMLERPDAHHRVRGAVRRRSGGDGRGRRAAGARRRRLRDPRRRLAGRLGRRHRRTTSRRGSRSTPATSGGSPST